MFLSHGKGPLSQRRFCRVVSASNNGTKLSLRVRPRVLHRSYNFTLTGVKVSAQLVRSCLKRHGVHRAI